MNEKTKDPFPDLPRRGLFADTKASKPMKPTTRTADVAGLAAAEIAHDQEWPKVPKGPGAKKLTKKLKAAKAALADVDKRMKSPPAEKQPRGRPRIADADKPWVKAGVSRMTWHRQQKATAAKVTS